MQVHSIILSNGFKVLYAQQKDSKVVGMSLLGKGGSSFEDIPGTAHFLEHIVLDGSQKYPSRKILSSIVQDSGGRTNARTGKEYVEFFVKATKSEIENGFEFLSQVFLNPLLREEDIKKEKNIILQEVNRALTDDSRQLFESMTALSYESQYMNRMGLGDKQSLEKIDKVTLEEFYKKQYTIDNFVLSIGGDFSIEYIKDLGEKYFGGIQNKGFSEFKTHTLRNKSGVKIVRKETASQAKIMLAFPSPLPLSEDYSSTVLTSYILGRGTLSRLFQTVREEKHLAYDISSWMYSGNQYSLMYIQAGFDEEKINEILSLVGDEIFKLTSKPPTERELTLAKKQFESNMIFNFENTAELAGYYATRSFLFPGLVSYEDELKNIQKVTRDDIKKAASLIYNGPICLSILAKNLKEGDVNLQSFRGFNK